MKPLILLLSILAINTLVAEQPMKGKMEWKKENIEGWVYTLVDDQTYEVLRFSQNGLVAATIGEKNGPVAGPLWTWKIKDQHTLLILEHDEKAVISLTLNSIRENRIHVTNILGENKVYEVELNQK